MGTMAWRDSSTCRLTTTVAFLDSSSKRLSAVSVRNRLSSQSSCTRTFFSAMAFSESTRAGSSSMSSCTCSARSSASARVRPTHITTGSPTKRTLPCASGGWPDSL